MIGFTQTGPVKVHSMWNPDGAIDLFYTQGRPVPAILLLHTRSIANAALPDKFWNVNESQGHLIRLQRQDPTYRVRYKFSQFSTPGVLSPDLDTAYVYPIPLPPGYPNDIQVSTKTRLANGEVDELTPFYSVTIQAEPQDTVYASRTGIVLHPPTVVERNLAQLILCHDDGGNMWYVGLHPQKIFVKEGETVLAGQPIGCLTANGKLEVFLSTLDTLPTPTEYQWNGSVITSLFVHFHPVHFSGAGGSSPVSASQYVGVPPAYSIAPDRPVTTDRDTATIYASYRQTVDHIRTTLQVDQHWPELLKMRNRWFAVFEDSTITDNFLVYVGNGLIHGVSQSQLQKYLSKNPLYGKEIANQFTAEDYQILTQNAALLALYSEGFIDINQPNENIPSPSIMEEMAWADIRDSMWVAEIGAGSGMISYFLARHHPNLQIFYNDVDWKVLQFAKWAVSLDSAVNHPLRIFPGVGVKKSTRLESFQFDRILIRDSFHHFSKMEEMLTSIRKSMTAQSQLIVNEPMGELTVGEGCKEVLSSEGVRTILKAAKFRILEEYIHPANKEIWFRCGI